MFIKSLVLSILVIGISAHAQHVNIVPIEGFEVSLGMAQINGRVQPIEIVSGKCKILSGEVGQIRWQAIGTSVTDANIFQALAVEFKKDCWLHFSRAFDRKGQRPFVQLTGPFEINSRGELITQYSQFGSDPRQQVEGLASRMSGITSGRSVTVIHVGLGHEKDKEIPLLVD